MALSPHICPSSLHLLEFSAVELITCYSFSPQDEGGSPVLKRPQQVLKYAFVTEIRGTKLAESKSEATQVCELSEESELQGNLGSGLECENHSSNE